MKSEKSVSRVSEKTAAKKSVPGEVYAAIAMVLYELSEEAHDVESGILTLQESNHPCRPWSFRGLGMRQIPVRK